MAGSSNSKTVKCPQCPKKFTVIEDAKKHLEEEFPGGKWKCLGLLNVCQVCDHATIQTTGIISHMCNKHGGDVARVNYRAGSKEFNLYNTVVTPYIPSEPTVSRSADQQDLVSVVNEQPAIPCIDTSSLPSISFSALPDHFLQEVAIMAKDAGLGSPKVLADVDPTHLFEFLQRTEGSKIPCAVFCAEIPDAEGDESEPKYRALPLGNDIDWLDDDNQVLRD